MPAAIAVDVGSPGSPPRRGVAVRYGLWSALAAGAALSLVVAYWIASQEILLGSRTGRWVYGYIQPFSWRPIAVFLAVSAAAAILLRASHVRPHGGDWKITGAWLAAAVGLQAALRWLTPFSFESIFASDGANSFYSVTRRYFASTVLSDFDQVRAYWPLHAQSNMPGKLMLVYLLEHVSTEPGVLAWLVVLVSNLGGVLLYLLVRDLFEDRRAALYSLVLYLFVPSKLFFFPLLNTVTPVVVLACAYLLVRWLRTGGSIHAALFGAALFGLVFFEPLPLVIGLLFAALSLRAIVRGTIGVRRFAVQCGVAAGAFAAVLLAVRMWFGFDLVGAFREIGTHALEFNTAAGRPYDVWIRENLREFVFGIGICQAVLVAAALGEGLARSGSWASRLSEPITAYCLGLLGVLIATDLIGVNRGEVIRLWIFLACFFQVPAAYVCARLESRTALGVVLATTVLQTALGTAMIGFILPG